MKSYECFENWKLKYCRIYVLKWCGGVNSYILGKVLKIINGI